MAASTCDGSCAPLAQLDPAAASTPVVVLEQEQQRLAVDLGEAQVDDARHEVGVGVAPRARRCRPRRPRAADDRVDESGPPGRGPGPEPGPLGGGPLGGQREPDGAGDVLGAAAPLALLAAADQLRLERARRRGRPAHPRPSGLRTCATASVTRSAGAACERPRRARTGPATRRCAAPRPAPARAPPRRWRPAAGSCRPRCSRAPPTPRATSGCRASARAARSTTPRASTGTVTPPARATGWSTAWCSTALHTATPGRARQRAAARPGRRPRCRRW